VGFSISAVIIERSIFGFLLHVEEHRFAIALQIDVESVDGACAAHLAPRDQGAAPDIGAYDVEHVPRATIQKFRCGAIGRWPRAMNSRRRIRHH